MSLYNENKPVKILQSETQNALFVYHLAKNNLDWDESRQCVIMTDKAKERYENKHNINKSDETSNNLQEQKQQYTYPQDLQPYSTTDLLHPEINLPVFPTPVAYKPYYKSLYPECDFNKNPNIINRMPMCIMGVSRIFSNQDKVHTLISYDSSYSKDDAKAEHTKTWSEWAYLKGIIPGELAELIINGHSMLKLFGKKNEVFSKDSRMYFHADYIGYDNTLVKNKIFTFYPVHNREDDTEKRNGCICKKALRQFYYIGTQIITIDIDNVNGFPTIEEFYDSLPYKPTLCYETYSDMTGKGKRFRCVYFLDKVLYGINAYKLIARHFKNILEQSPYVAEIDECSRVATQIMFGTSRDRHAIYSNIIYTYDYIESVIKGKIDECLGYSDSEKRVLQLFIETIDYNHLKAENSKRSYKKYYKLFNDYLKSKKLKFKSFKSNILNTSNILNEYKSSKEPEIIAIRLIDYTKGKNEKFETCLKNTVIDYLNSKTEDINIENAKHILTYAERLNLETLFQYSKNKKEKLELYEDLKDLSIDDINEETISRYFNIFNKSQSFKNFKKLNSLTGNKDLRLLTHEEFYDYYLKNKYPFYKDFKEDYLISAGYTEKITGLSRMNVLTCDSTQLSSRMECSLKTLFRDRDFEKFRNDYPELDRIKPGYSNDVLRHFKGKNFMFAPKDALCAFIPMGEDMHMFTAGDHRRRKCFYYLASLRLSAPDMPGDWLAYHGVLWMRDHLVSGLDDEKATLQYLTETVRSIMSVPYETLKENNMYIFNNQKAYYQTKNNIIYKKGRVLREENRNILDYLFNKNLTIGDNILMMQFCYGYTVGKSTLYNYIKERGIQNITERQVKIYSKVRGLESIMHNKFCKFYRKYREEYGDDVHSQTLYRLHKAYKEEYKNISYDVKYSVSMDNYYKTIDAVAKNCRKYENDKTLCDIRYSLFQLSNAVREDLMKSYNKISLYDITNVNIEQKSMFFDFSKFMLSETFNKFTESKDFKDALVTKRFNAVTDFIHKQNIGDELMDSLYLAA